MVPQQIGRYKIKSELGRGGMATVYKAYDPRFRREVALKVLPREFLHDPTFHARFEREAQTIAALEHPAIVPVYDYGEEEGQPYLVMRYLPGGTLTGQLEQKHLSLAETVRIMNYLAPALDEAHRHNIIHRDLKPDNILFDQHQYPFITDFGIVKLSEDSPTITTGYVIIGTPAYMSPEQARGDSVIDARSDIYALGVILFQMLTGKLPFNAKTPVGMVMKHITEPVPDILEFAPNLPPGCRAVIGQAMAKVPDKRYATATALAAALANSAHLKSGPALAPVPARAPLPASPKISPPAQPTPALETISCPNCHTSNATEKRYCSNCGYQLQIDCVQCYTPNRINATMCVHCGVNLEQSRALRQELDEARQRTKKEREQALIEKEARQQQERLQQIIDSLQDSTRHEFAIYRLSQLGQSAIMALIEVLFNHSHPAARYGAVKALGQICNEHKIKPLLKGRLVKALIVALTDPEPLVRLWAAEALGNFSGQLGQLAVEPLGDLLKDRHEGVRHQARRSLQAIDGQRARELLTKSRGVMGWLKGGKMI